MGLIKIEVNPEYARIYKGLQPTLQQVNEVFRAYLRFDRKQFTFLSTSNLGLGIKATLALISIAILLNLAWAVIGSFALGEPLYRAIWLTIKTGIVPGAIAFVAMYLGLHMFGGKSLGLMILNLWACLHIVLIIIFAPLAVAGVAASGSFYEDVLAARTESDRTTVFYEVFCRPIELYGQELRYLALANQLRQRIDMHDAYYHRPFRPHPLHEEAEIERITRQATMLAHALRRNHAAQYLLVQQYSLKEALTTYAPFFVVVGLVILLFVFGCIWNIMFLITASRQGPSWWDSTKATLRVMVACAMAAFMTFVYVQSAEGTPVWQTDPEAREMGMAMAGLRRIHPICGVITLPPVRLADLEPPSE